MTRDELASELRNRALTEGAILPGSVVAKLLGDAADRIEADGKLIAEMREALTAIAELTERKVRKYPEDWREQIADCPECRRYKDHPIQRGICDVHSKPIYAQQEHDEHETRILGYRAKDIARAILARLDAEAQR
jgi:hypothetical protein